MKIKEMFNNARAKVANMSLTIKVKEFFNKIKTSKPVTAATNTVSTMKSKLSDFLGSHNNVKDSMAGDVSNRFSSKIKKFFRNIVKNLSKKAEGDSKLAKFGVITLKVVCTIAAIAFACLVIYCIKDVFLHCLMLVAMCAAVAICIEFILSILSIATGCKI